MSEENVRVLREMYGRRTIDEAAELMHPAAEMHQPSALPDTDEYYGREELVRGLAVFGLEAGVEAGEAPSEVRELAERRREARAARDFDEADRLRGEIDAAGWEVQDVADGFRLVPRS